VTGHDGAKPFVSNDVNRFDAAELPPTGLIAISGPSGAGKSTLLRMLAGIEAPSSGVAALPRLTTGGCVWMSTEIYVPAGKLSDAIAWNCASVGRSALRQAAESVGLIDETLLPGGLDARIAEGGANLSGGQRVRIGIARILISDRVVFADEPTAKLDPTTAALVRRVLTEVAARRLVIVATHDDRLIEVADRHHSLTLPKQRQTAIAA
jgi:ATP-binding cassette subfamily C protein